jgi:hypothetical protein
MRSTLGTVMAGCESPKEGMRPPFNHDGRAPLPLTSWNDVATALDELVALSARSLDVFDHSLMLQQWGSTARTDALIEAMAVRRVRIRMLVREPNVVNVELARLMRLLKNWGHLLTIMVAPDAAFGTANFVVVDQQHLLFRPNSVQSRGSVNLFNPYKSKSYLHTFEVSWQQAGPRVFPEAFGL